MDHEDLGGHPVRDRIPRSLVTGHCLPVLGFDVSIQRIATVLVFITLRSIQQHSHEAGISTLRSRDVRDDGKQSRLTSNRMR